MTVYVFFFLLLLLTSLSSAFSRYGRWRKIVLVALGIFLCTGYMTGSDWRAYETMFQFANDAFFWEGYNKEWGFVLLLKFFKFLQFDFWWFWILMKVFCFWVVVKTLRQYTLPGSMFYWALFYFYAYFAIFYFIDNPMRNLFCAALFILLAYPAIRQNQWKRYWGVVALCSLFHMAVLLVSPFYYVLRRKKFVSAWLSMGGG